MRDSIGELLIFLAFAGISLLVKFLEQKKKAEDKVPPPASVVGSGKGETPAAAPGEWTPDYETLKEFAEKQKRAGRPLDPTVAAALEAARFAVPKPEVPAGPSEEELAMLEEQRRLAELAAELERRRQDAAAAFAPAAPEEDAMAAAVPAQGGGALACLRRNPQSAVVLAEVLAPPAALRPRRSF